MDSFLVALKQTAARASLGCFSTNLPEKGLSACVVSRMSITDNDKSDKLMFCLHSSLFCCFFLINYVFN